MTTRLSVYPFDGIEDGSIVIGRITSKEYWEKSLPGSKGPIDDGKYLYRVRIIDHNVYENVQDVDLPLCDVIVRPESSTPVYIPNEIVFLIKKSAKYFILGKESIGQAACDSGQYSLSNPSLNQQPIDGRKVGSDVNVIQDVNVLSKRNEDTTETTITGACSNKGEYDGMQSALKNFLATYENIKSYATSYLGAATKIVGDLEAELKKTASIIGGFIQTLFQKIRGYVIEKIKKAIETVKNTLHPPDKKTVNTAANKAIDTISCLFDKILDRALPIIEQFLNDVVNRFVNAPMCAVESAIGSLTASVTQDIGQGIDSALGPVKSILGSIGQVVGNIFEVGDFVASVLGFFTCDSGKPLCPGVKNWGWIDGPNPKEVANFSNIVTNFNLSGGTQALLGSATAAGLGTAPGTLGYAIGLGSGPASTAPPCDIGPQECGPPSISFFGGGGTGSIGNPIISSTGSILGVDITNKGSTYTAPPFVSFVDNCGNGSGASAQAYLDASGSLAGIFMKSSGGKYLASKNGSTGGNKKTKFPAGYSAVSVQPIPLTLSPTTGPGPFAPSTTPTSPLIATKFLNGFTLEVSPSVITEGQSFIIKLIPPSSVNVGDIFTAKLTTDTPTPDSIMASLSKTLVFNRTLAPVVDNGGVKEISPHTISTISDTIKEKDEKITIEIVEVPGLSVTIDVNDDTKSPFTSTSSLLADIIYEVQDSISVKEGETVQVVVRRTGKNLDVETTVDYEISNFDLLYSAGDPKKALEGTHFLYPKDSSGVRSPKGTITFAKMQKDYTLDIITLSSVALLDPTVGSRNIQFKISKNAKSSVLEDFSKGESLITINERKPPEKDAGTPFYQAPLINRIKALKETGLFDPSAKQIVKFKDAGTVTGEIYIGSLPEVKLFLTELNKLPTPPDPLTIESIESVERLQVLALNAVLNLYIKTVGGSKSLSAAGIIRELNILTDVWEFYDFFKDTGGAARKDEYVTKDGRKGFVLEDRFTQSGYSSTKENIPLFWELVNIQNDDIQSFSLQIKSDEVKYAGSTTVYWNLRNISPYATQSEIKSASRSGGGDVAMEYGNAIHTKLDTAPGYGVVINPDSTIIDAVSPLPQGTDPTYPDVGYVAPELPNRLFPRDPKAAGATYKYTITLVAYIKDALGGGILSNSVDFYVEG